MPYRVSTYEASTEAVESWCVGALLAICSEHRARWCSLTLLE